ncbi:chromosome segregation protein SMC [Spongiactinospora gelatinilytica]|uniref:Nuclease SbcCD subunit C n=1 Tax=Spongiactinospora gelatinilytica TaxID=2666298 RepID=A0A2W2GZ30_9ACTN|nr:SMC family ATPase [Spongiactinospora gelatinilytica]PZG52933.1 chromosome segregation protein SMC [Spongiactinospora gelatinilytica]
MRPLHLHLADFGSFREPVTIDFTDVDYFALVGPTGAGKSTVIDAICFALYGTVPRWGRENVIAHALAPSAASGKVALVFESAGRRHGVVRALQRDAKGRVHTKEARLDELDPSVPATAGLDDLMGAVLRPIAEGDAVTAEVQRVTGLEYRFFTQCVVLPQGRFAEFLHAQPRERQDLLVQLLDADVYERIRQRAVREEDAAKQAAAFARGRLARLADADEAAEQAAAARLESLRGLAERARSDLRALRERDDAAAALRQERTAARQRLTALTALAMPPDVPTLADSVRQAAEALARMSAEVAKLAEAEQRADDERAALGDKAALTALLTAVDDQERVARALGSAKAAAASAATGAAKPAEAEQRAAAALAEAERDRERLRDAHAAADLARRLAVGEPCPTCLRAITELPHHPAPADLGAAERTVRARGADLERARADRRRAEVEAARVKQKADELEGQLAVLAARAAAADRARVAAELTAIEAAEERLARARRATRAARGELARAERRAAELREKSERSWREVDAARDRVVVLGAPPIDRADLHAAWTSLLSWREEAATAERKALGGVETELAAVERARDQERSALVARLAGHEVQVAAGATPETIHETLARSVVHAEHRLARVRENRVQAKELAEQAAAKEREEQVAHELTLLLRANAFERWLCAEALALLVAEASVTLNDLSGGQYELVLGERGEIEVIDHAEAGLRRSARTLSGGETFQAALALALALSSQVAGLAATAARSLDSIFLDEGFGTLDPATLDTVAATLERLAAGNDRMVGVVTHVPALADRVPVRFEVSRDGQGSHLRRVVS